MARSALVNVYCPGPDCQFQGKVKAERYVGRESARRCPECGATPVRIEIPGWSRELARTTPTLLEARP